MQSLIAPGPGRLGMEALTRRENEILRLLADQERCRQIAAHLGIAELTVRKHRANICAKLGLTSSAGLIAYALQPRPLQLPARLEQQLTPREQQILHAIGGGLTSKQVARQLGISPRTVEKHRENCMRKLGTDTLPALLRQLSGAQNDYVFGCIHPAAEQPQHARAAQTADTHPRQQGRPACLADPYT